MKLIDLLVQELPKHGGWPEGAVECQRFVDEATIDFYDENGNLDDDCSLTYGPIASQLIRKQTFPCESGQVTRKQYESALAASQKPAWNGEGVPPVGCECEFISNDTSWGAVMVIGIDGDKVVFRPSGESYYGITPSERQIFRPLNHETKIKQEAIKKIKELLIFDYGDDPRVNDATFIYDAIAAGKIPGVKLED